MVTLAGFFFGWKINAILKPCPHEVIIDGVDPMNLDERDPFDYFNDENVPIKPEQSSSGNLVNNLRSELQASSEVEPADDTILQKLNLKLIVGIIIGIVILCLIFILLMGPGRSMLERRLVSLKRAAPTYTQQVKVTPIPNTKTPDRPTHTITKNPTTRPTNTATIEAVVMSTQIPASVTPTSDSGCRDVLTVTLADVGQTLCVQGTIIETIANPTNFMVIFSTEKGSFYWVTYDLVWFQAELDTCYRTTGTIDQIANSPVLLFGYYNLPEECP